MWTRKISSIGNVTTCDKVTNWHIDWLEMLTICHSRFKFPNLRGRHIIWLNNMSHKIQGRTFKLIYVHDNAVKCGRGCGFIFRTIKISRFPMDHSGFRFDVREGMPTSACTYRLEERYDWDHTILLCSMQQFSLPQHFYQLHLFLNYLLQLESDIISNQKQFRKIAGVTLPPFSLDT